MIIIISSILYLIANIFLLNRIQKNMGRQIIEKAHSKFSASGAERWFNCPGSVELSQGISSYSSPYAEEGTKAHAVLEKLLRHAIDCGFSEINFTPQNTLDSEDTIMGLYAEQTVNFLLKLYFNNPYSELLIETRIYLDFIHPEMFGTFDGAIIDYFGTLHVFDYKYGKGHVVSPKDNLQMLFYGIGLAYKYHWNFKKVRLWIIQPRIKGYDGPIYWEQSIFELKSKVRDFEKAVERVLKNPSLYIEGSWCHWCAAKSICPKKETKKLEKAKDIWSNL